MDTKNTEKELMDIDTAIAYAQLALHVLQHSGAEINAKTLKNEIKMFHQKFGTKEVKRLSNIFTKERKLK